MERFPGVDNLRLSFIQILVTPGRVRQAAEFFQMMGYQVEPLFEDNRYYTKMVSDFHGIILTSCVLPESSELRLGFVISSPYLIVAAIREWGRIRRITVNVCQSGKSFSVSLPQLFSVTLVFEPQT